MGKTPSNELETVNITYGSHDHSARRCSNFSPDPFELDGLWFASVEGFYVSIILDPSDPDVGRARVSVAFAAKKLGRKAERKYVWWQGKRMNYGSSEHHALLERAIRAKFEQNPEAMHALQTLRGYRLTHDTGEPDSKGLPETVFCGILTRIRDEQP